MRIVSEYESYNFCLDKQKLSIEKLNTQAKYVRITLEGKIVVGDNEKDFSFSYDIPYFQDRVNIDIGQKIHNFYLKYAKNLLNGAINHFILSPTLVKVFVENLDKSFSSLTRTEIGEYSFYPGKKPKAYPILTHHLLRRRVGDSKILLSYVSGEVSPQNWGLLYPLVPIINNRDVGALKLTNTEMIFPKIKEIDNIQIINFPDVRDAVHIQWLNQNLVPEWATFTGEYKIQSSFNHSIGKSSFTAERQKFDTDIEKSIKINTGFILKAEIPMIEELMQSPFCFIELNDRILKTIPNMDKIGTEDSTTQLIQFDLEFLITDEVWK